MTFRTIIRPKAQTPLPFCATKPDGIRLATHRTGQHQVLVIWMGTNVARRLGLLQARHCVDVLIDDDSVPSRRFAIRPAEHGEYRAARRGQCHAIYIDGTTRAALFPEILPRHIDAANIKIEDGMLQFVLSRGSE